MRKLFTLCSMICAVMMLSACQFFVDGRDDTLMVVTAVEWAEVNHKAALHDEAEMMRSRPMPLPGSELISFTNNADAYLAGCRSLGIVEVHHYGTDDEALILMRNEAVKLSATAIVPLDFYQDKSQTREMNEKLSFMKGRVVTCPDNPANTGA